MTTHSKQVRPLEALKTAVDLVCQANARTAGRTYGETYVGGDYLLVSLRRRPIVIEGRYEDVIKGEHDLFDLMGEFTSINSR